MKHMQTYYVYIQHAQICKRLHMLINLSLYKYICHERMYILSGSYSDHSLQISLYCIYNPVLFLRLFNSLSLSAS